MTMLTTSTFWNTFLRTPNEASAKGTGTDSYVQYPSTAQSLSDACLRCTWAGIKQSKFILWETSVRDFVLTCQDSAWRCAHKASLSLHAATVSVSSTIAVPEHVFVRRTEDWAVLKTISTPQCILLFATQLAMKKEIYELAYYYNLCKEKKKKPKPNTQVYHFKWTWLYILCVNHSIIVRFYCKIKQFWKGNLKDPTNHSNNSNSLGNLQSMANRYAVKEALYRTCILPSITLRLLAMYRLAENRHPI